MEVLTKTGFVPYYYQLKEILHNSIRHGELKPGQSLPSERELCDRYKVSRITIRKALDLLLMEGLIYREQGRGTFVASLPLEQPARIISFTEQMKLWGLTPSTKVLKTGILTGDRKLAEHLALTPEEEVVFIRRLRFADREPVALENSYLPHKLFPRILSENLGGSLTRITEDRYHLHLARAQQTVKAELSCRELARLLRTRRGSPLLFVRRTAFLSDNRPAEYLEAHYRGDRYEITMELKGR